MRFMIIGRHRRFKKLALVSLFNMLILISPIMKHGFLFIVIFCKILLIFS